MSFRFRASCSPTNGLKVSDMYGLIYFLVSPESLEIQSFKIFCFSRDWKGLLHLSLLALCVIHVNICEVNIV